ncbi:hypothetical protein ACGFZ9_47405 [Streptomyces mirabilis]|uniref:hypothetical protein n=1 Tax=Streptomyces mirabilis TaxID=68239 RepID=UPI003720908E
MTAAADKLAHEDLSDVGILRLAGVLAPVVLLAADRDLIRQGVAVPNWQGVRAVLGRIGAAEAGMQGSTTALVGAGYGLAGAVRLARAHPVAAGMAAAAGTYAYLNRDRLSSDTRAKLARFGTEAFKILGEPFVQHEVHGRDWVQAQRGTAGDDVLSRGDSVHPSDASWRPRSAPSWPGWSGSPVLPTRRRSSPTGSPGAWRTR